MLLAGCEDSRHVHTDISIGSLVCPDSAAFASARSVSLPDQCPLLVIAIDKQRGRVRAIGPSDEETWLDAAALKKVADARLPAALAGAMDSAIDHLASSPDSGTLVPRSDFGLIFRNASGASDTVFVGDLPSLRIDSLASPDLDSCLDALARSPAYGFLRAPFAPALKCGNDSMRILSVLAKPDPRLTPSQEWIFLASKDRHRQWIWRMRGGRARMVEVPFMENSEIESLSAEDMDGDSIPELIVRIATYNRNSRFSTLKIIRGAEQEDPAAMGSMHLDWYSGEEGGSTVEAEWWLCPPHLYSAYAQTGNAGGRGNSHDIRIDAFGFTAAGGLAAERKTGFTVAVFGPLDTKWGARGRCDSLSSRWPEARKAGLHPFPRLTSNGILWQAGVIAPDARTAERWREWDGSGAILEVYPRKGSSLTPGTGPLGRGG
ncbi:MAG: hypothetical protein ABIW76_11525 [Fibrobacteria bacterium]